LSIIKNKCKREDMGVQGSFYAIRGQGNGNTKGQAVFGKERAKVTHKISEKKRLGGKEIWGKKGL